MITIQHETFVILPNQNKTTVMRMITGFLADKNTAGDKISGIIVILIAVFKENTTYEEVTL